MILSHASLPDHIGQKCNAFAAMQNGAGIIEHNFNLSNLCVFSKLHVQLSVCGMGEIGRIHHIE